MNKAIFLDRDGVVNVDRGDYTFRIEDFEFVPGIFDDCQKLIQKGYHLIVITNQAGIAKGLYTHQQVDELHHFMTRQFADKGVPLLEVYYCPHHESYSRCLCRKPGSLLLEKALARFELDAASSYFIGDRERDIEAGNNAGVKGILVKENTGLQEILSLIK